MVPISVTASYYGDTHGDWEGTPGFLYYESIYLFSFSNFEVSSLKEYQQMMDVYNNTLHYYGELSSRQNLGLNVVLWVSLVRYYSTADPFTSNFTSAGRGHLQYMELTGDPSVVFDSHFTGIAMSSSFGFCDLPVTVDFNPANAVFKASLSSDSYSSNPICKPIVSPFVFTDANAQNPQFNIQLDTRSLSIAIAANLNYLNSEDLLIASASTFRLDIPVTSTINVTYEIGEYFDTRYPYMKPIFCLKNVTQIPATVPHILELCLVNTGTGLFLPVINHLGRSMKQPDYCDCQNGNGRDAQCNQLYLMAGLIVFPTNISSPSDTSSIKQNIRDAYALVAKHGNYAKLNRASFDASSASALHSSGSADPSIVNTAYMKNAFQFCKLPNGKLCSLINFYTLGMSLAVSKYHFPIVDGSCKNVLNIHNDDWKKLSVNPPTPLHQIYHSCLPATYDVLIDAIGIASGNTSIAILVLIFVCFPIVILMMACCRVYPRSLEYHEKEKRRTLDTLATLILRIRDEHYEGIAKNGTISNVAEEMMKAVAYSNNKLISESSKAENQRIGAVKSKSLRFKSTRSIFALTEDELAEHRGYLGRIYVYRHRKPNRKGDSSSVLQRSRSNYSSPELPGISLKTISNDYYERIEEGASPVTPAEERPTFHKQPTLRKQLSVSHVNP
jgi:hypothetical protein